MKHKFKIGDRVYNKLTSYIGTIIEFGMAGLPVVEWDDSSHNRTKYGPSVCFPGFLVHDGYKDFQDKIKDRMT